MALWKTYYLARELKDALETLAHSPGATRLVAGGTDLLLDLQQGRCPPVDTLVDITRVPELRCLEIRGDSLFIGAAVPLSSLVASPLIQVHTRALRQACSLVGGPQVRNTATLGGNVAHALPAGDGSIALLALDAQVEVATPVSSRLIPLAELYHGPGQSALAPGKEILVGFYVPFRQPGDSSAFQRIMRPQGVALPVLNMAIWLHREGNRVMGARIALGPAGPVPHRAREAEKRLLEKELTHMVIQDACQSILETARFRTSPHRASAGYRQHLARVLLSETIMAAWENTYDEFHS